MPNIIYFDENNITDTFINSGYEGKIYNYKNKYALKIFHYRIFFNNKKIRELKKIKHPNFCFPLGFVKNYDEESIGYYMPLVQPADNKYPNIILISELEDINRIFNIVLKGSNAIKWAHENMINIGDIRGENILIDTEYNPIFCDTNNYYYKYFKFDLIPPTLVKLGILYGIEFSYDDIDRWLYAKMILELYLIKSGVMVGDLFRYDNFYKRIIELLHVNKEVKEGLRLIFSSAKNKPYLGEVIKSLNPNELILTDNDKRKLLF